MLWWVLRWEGGCCEFSSGSCGGEGEGVVSGVGAVVGCVLLFGNLTPSEHLII